MKLKTFNEFVSEESAAQANVTGSAIANPDVPMVGIKKCQFMKMDVFEVDHDTFTKCRAGKKLGDRWNKYVSDPDLQGILKKNFQKGKSVLIQSSLTKGITYLRN